MYLRALATALLGVIPAVAIAGDNPFIVVNDLRDLPQLFAGPCDADNLLPGEQCTLRAAVQLANSRAGHDTIILTLGAIYPLTLAGDGGASVGDLDITDDVLISGIILGMPADPSSLPTVDASGLADRIFDIAVGVDVELRALQLVDADPGAIRNDGELLVDRCRIADNGGGSEAPAIQLASAGAELLVLGSHFEGNHSTGFSAAIDVGSGSAVIRRSSFRNNTSSSANATIDVSFNGAIEIEDSTVGGSEDSWIGLRALNPERLVVRNSTFLEFEGNAIRVSNLQGGRPVDIANSILANGNLSCQLLLAPDAVPDIRIGHSLVQSQNGCSAYYDAIVEGEPPTLAAWTQQPGQVHWHRSPRSSVLNANNLIDAGIAATDTPASPAQACTSADQRGVERPRDGLLTGTSRCDLGAIEVDRPGSAVFVVNHADEDLYDADIGNGICEAAPGSGLCTLRAAIAEANARPGLDAVTFASNPNQPIVLTLAPGGDLDITDDLIIHGAESGGRPQTTVLQQVDGQRIVEILGSDVLLHHLRMTGGSSAGSSGGAVRVADGSNARLEAIELFGNHSDTVGGAVSVIGSGATVGLVDVDLYDNSAPVDGAALYVGELAMAFVEQSSFWSNAAADAAGWTIFAAEDAFLDVVASTVASNAGGGIRGDWAIYLSVSSSTVANNTGVGVSAALNHASQSFDLQSSIVSGNGSLDCFTFNSGGVGDVDRSYNLIQDGSCLADSPSSFAADPQLSGLTRAEGRLSRFMRPSYVPDGSSSPALDVAPSWSACGASADQRGLPRPIDLNIADVDGPCDLGAVEVRLSLDGDSIFSNGFQTLPTLN